MMTIEEKIKVITGSTGISDPELIQIMPAPDMDSGYYFVYFPDTLYKEALIDIIRLTDEGMRIWYDRRLESGAVWQRDTLDKIDDYGCLGTILYLSPDSLMDPFFYEICDRIAIYDKQYCSINYAFKDGKCLSGAAMTELAECSELPEEAKRIFCRLFNREITFVSGKSSVAEKKRGILNMKRDEALIYVYKGDEATIVGLKDMSVEVLDIPAYTVHENKRYTVTEIAALAFAGCTSLKKVNFPSTLKRVGFMPNQDIKEFAVGNILPRMIAEFVGGFEDSVGGVFKGCNGIKTLIFPDSLKEMGPLALDGCKNLHSVNMGGITVCAENVFGYVGIIEDKEFYDGSLSKIVFPSTVYRTKSGWFASGNLVRLAIPCTVQKIKGGTKFVAPEIYELPEGARSAGVLAYSDSVREAIIPSSIGLITDGEFVGCVNLEKVVFKAKSIKIVCNDGLPPFAGCKSLHTVELTSEVGMLDLGAFAGCEQLKSLRLPAKTAIVINSLCWPFRRIFARRINGKPRLYVKTLFLESSDVLFNMQVIRHKIYSSLSTLRYAYLPENADITGLYCFKEIKSNRVGMRKLRVKKFRCLKHFSLND